MLSEKPWTIERVAVMLSSFAVCFFLFGFAQLFVMHLAGQKEVDVNSGSYFVFVLVSPQSCILTATAFVLWWCQVDWRQAFGFVGWSVRRSLFYGVLGAIVFLPVGAILQSLSILIYRLVAHHNPPAQEAIAMLENIHNPVNLALSIVLAVVLAPLGEEVLFRGILYPAIKRLGFPRAALFISASLFAAIHASWPVFVPLMVLGMMQVWLYERTDNLLAPITAHSVFNAINLMEFFWTRAHHAAPGWINLFGR